MLITILLTLFGIAGIVLQFFSENIINEKMHKKKIGLIITGIAIFGLVISNILKYENENTLNNNIDILKTNLDSSRIKISKQDIILEKYQADLDDKERIIQDLTVKVKKAEKGISVTYDFSGNKWETVRHGNNKLVYGSEFEIFSKMQTLEQQKKYQELIPICEEQIKKTSEWLTPYLYLGIAYANLGNKEKAIELFEHVQRNALGDPEYSEVNDFLKGLKGN